MSPVRRGRARAAPVPACLVAGVLVVTGCAEATTGPAAGAPSGTAAGPTSAPVRTDAPDVLDVLEVTVAVQDGQVEPPPRRVDVELGAVVRLKVTSDRADELHVHGFGDPEVALEPGVPVSLDLQTDETGQFEVETHESRLTLLTLAVR